MFVNNHKIAYDVFVVLLGTGRKYKKSKNIDAVSKKSKKYMHAEKYITETCMFYY